MLTAYLMSTREGRFGTARITLVVVSLNLCGDWRRDLLDPRPRK